mmetsp:Transcript_20401/g.31496  ORF Transcript_20401/g.31496 Transcript_20401/m.31496 type:complete len:165 (-) Transcript_20401:1522-2016(-)
MFRVGIDFGNTIGNIEDDQPAYLAYETIKHIVCKFDTENVFIVSKAGPSMEDKIRRWLDDTAFYNMTGFLLENVLFVREYADKKDVVESLGISIFFDDHVKVVRVLAPVQGIERIFWMNASPSDIHHIPKFLRKKIAIVKDWPRTIKYFQNIPRLRVNEEAHEG